MASKHPARPRATPPALIGFPSQPAGAPLPASFQDPNLQQLILLQTIVSQQQLLLQSQAATGTFVPAPATATSKFKSSRTPPLPELSPTLSSRDSRSPSPRAPPTPTEQHQSLPPLRDLFEKDILVGHRGAGKRTRAQTHREEKVVEVDYESDEETKRRKNSEASARFRARKKVRDAEMKENAERLRLRVNALEKETESLKAENQWLRDLISDKAIGAGRPVVA
ncbi:hypothetical protein MNV49_001784 [Pseudohyphozyma bogoriensis]|nr:hypothetical protein MNV49_001784 [Pseudohyphozyma bogoriensis]